MPTIICIEGPDNVGKTTVAKYLVKKLKFKYIHFSVPASQEEAKESYFHIIENAARYNKKLVLDRSWIGEFTYAPILRGYKPNYFDDIELLIKIKDINLITILLTCSKRKVKSMPIIEKNLAIIKRHEEICSKFIKVFNQIQVGSKFHVNIGNFLNSYDVCEHVKNTVENAIKQQIGEANEKQI